MRERGVLQLQATPILRGIQEAAAQLTADLDSAVAQHAEMMGAFPGNFLTDIVRSQDAHGGALHAGDSYVHVSQLVGDYCPRQHILMQDPEIQKMMAPQRVNGAQHVVWKMGLEAERHVIHQLIAGGINAFGRWSCSCGGLEVHDVTRDEANQRECPVCETTCTRYKQMTFRHAPLEIVGNADLAFWHEDQLAICETKSMNRTDFEQLNAPRREHVLQAALYQWMSLRSLRRTHPQITIIYICKDYLARGSIYKEFHIDTARDPSIAAALRVMQDAAADTADHRRAGRLPERRACPEATCSRAKNCPVLVPCFLKD